MDKPSKKLPSRYILRGHRADGSTEDLGEVDIASTAEDLERRQLYLIVRRRGTQPATDAELHELRAAGKDALAEELHAHTLRGLVVKRAAAEGGRERARVVRRNPKGPPAQVLCGELRVLRERNPRMSWTSACDRIGKRHGISGRTVCRRAAAADWRRHK